MIKKFISILIFLSLSLTCKIQANASSGLWLYIENISLEPIYQVEETQQENVEITEQEPPLLATHTITIDNHSGMKTWMPHHLFGKQTLQYQIQQNAYTDPLGLRQINGRYIVAVGTGVNADVGQYIDIILENGEVIPAIVGDIKDDNDTDALNLTTVFSGCVAEFIVERKVLTRNIKRSGDVSLRCDSWKSPIVEFVVYDLNVLERNDNESQI